MRHTFAVRQTYKKQRSAGIGDVRALGVWAAADPGLKGVSVGDGPALRETIQGEGRRTGVSQVFCHGSRFSFACSAEAGLCSGVRQRGSTMELAEKNGQASMEEILASIRRIIAEEPGGPAPVIDLDAPVRHPRGDGLLDDPSDFDLPSMFKVQSPAAPERPTPLFGRLSEAIRAASNGTHATDAPRAEPGLSTLKLNRHEEAEAPAIAPSFLLAHFHEATGPRVEDTGAVAEGPLPAAHSDSTALATSRTATNGYDMASTYHHAQGVESPVQAAPDTPQVPRQMAAFKDTRFRSMGSAPVNVEPIAPVISPFETAATAALVAAADPQPTTIPPIDLEVADAAPAALAEAITASYPAVISDPVLVAPPSPPPVPPAAVEVSVPAPVAAASETRPAPIEDATADLLRPMLRQWLADNMPRMVEKALHIEVAESVKSVKK
jgi:cell pole-organizing protein PopZ